jgi:hypothetical protein
MKSELWKRVEALVRSGRITDAVQYLERGLSNCTSPRFKALVGGNFSNDPKDVAKEIGRFIHVCEKSFPVGAVYLEMNGFDINPDRWYFDFFAYRSYVGDSKDLDWLSEWDSGEWPEATLTGLEEVQSDFAWYTGHKTKGYEDEIAQEAADFADLLVMCKFAGLIEEAVKTGLIEPRVPILATAHDFDIVARFAA